MSTDPATPHPLDQAATGDFEMSGPLTGQVAEEKKPQRKVVPLHRPGLAPLTEHNTIINEKPIHRVMAYMMMQGYNDGEIGKATNYSKEHVGVIRKQEWFSELIAKLSEDRFSDALDGLLEGAALEAVTELRNLATTAKSESVRKSASDSLLDRFLGKPTPRIKDLGEGSGDELNDAEKLRAEIKELEDQRLSKEPVRDIEK